VVLRGWRQEESHGENIERRKLQVDRVVPLHGATAPFADLLAHGAAQSEGSALSPRR
jgi:hypothetical protein